MVLRDIEMEHQSCTGNHESLFLKKVHYTSILILYRLSADPTRLSNTQFVGNSRRTV